MREMYFYFNAAIISILVSGIACLIIGIITLIKDKKRKPRGIRLTILGAIITMVFSATLIKVLYEEIVNNGDFLSISLFFLFFFFPFEFLAVVICLIYFLAIGVTSLKEGYTKNEEGKFNKESIVLGYIMLVLGIIVIFSFVMFIGASLSYIQESISESINKRDSRLASSSSDSESLESLNNYLFSVLYK